MNLAEQADGDQVLLGNSNVPHTLRMELTNSFDVKYAVRQEATMLSAS